MAGIAGCFAVWAWCRGGASALWLLLGFAGRAFAAYRGVYIAASLLWMWTAEWQRPNMWGLAGAALCLMVPLSFWRCQEPHEGT